ncbi:MAG: hypothetical protein L0H73_06370 [Nitrococcus sp.]|nr:hypothetical protein [Nitrococcus sp.]
MGVTLVDGTIQDLNSIPNAKWSGLDYRLIVLRIEAHRYFNCAVGSVD